MKSNRLYFIDTVRAFAILMMLQGHFVDALLDVSYRDKTNSIFTIWEYFRGNTAPIFFTISGLIFTYLLIKAKKNGSENRRMRKGLLRGLMLIGVGYLLRADIFSWFVGYFNPYFWVIDVLQCIGLSLIGIVIFYRLTFKKTLLFSITMLLFGLFIFTTEPLYRHYDGGNFPLFIANYLSTANGSIFTVLPWFGHMAFGAFIATLFYKYLHHKTFKIYIITGFFVFGFILIFFSSDLLEQLYFLTKIDVFIAAANYNYLYFRLGNVLVVFALFYAFERFIKQPLILKIGQKTLSIYIIHFIILYGSFTGFGLYQFIGKTLNPYQAIFGALAFLIIICFISFYYTKTNTFIYIMIRKLIDKIKYRH